VTEQVEKVNLALVARDENGKPYTVHYEAVNAVLLNEFLKEHRKGRGTGSHDQPRKVNCCKAGSDHRATTKGLPGAHRAAAENNQRSYGKPQRAGGANPEGQRPSLTRATCTASGQRQSVKLRRPNQQPLFAISRQVSHGWGLFVLVQSRWLRVHDQGQVSAWVKKHGGLRRQKTAKDFVRHSPA